MALEKTIRFQEALKSCPTIYAVFISLDGEHEVASLWETERAADMCRDQHNSMPGNGAAYYGKASVRPMRIRTEAMALGLYAVGKTGGTK